MKRITDFIVEKRYYVFSLFVLLAIFCYGLSSKVDINYDMSSYLPSDSDTKLGLNIMNDEFGAVKTSTLNVLVKGLSEQEAKDHYDYLSDLDNVSNVTYTYDDDKTIFQLICSKEADSDEASVLYKEVENHFQKQIDGVSGDVVDHNSSVLPFYVIVIAVLSALIILIIMCESYIEPFLFLFSILIAVALNAGTNIIFGSVSNITSSISSILQMALSMDYSIMLMNRYRQERQNETDKVVAMKKALFNVFKAICSSSVTTIVGLLALVFMSFTIGRDLGFVLAKGVLFSLVSIFTCLPCMILVCDKLIFKTRKKSLNINMKPVSRFAYHFRRFAVVIFVVIFMVSFFLKGNLNILYTSSGSEGEDSLTSFSNQMVLLYPNDKENDVSAYLKTLENNKQISQILGYGNTINRDLTYDQLKDAQNDIDIDDDILKLLYYYYYNNNDLKISFDKLVKFIKDDGSDLIDNSFNVNQLANFTSRDMILQQRDSTGLSNVFGIDKQMIDDLFIYYNSNKVNTKLTINQLISFINDTVLTNQKYQVNINDDMKNKIKQMSLFLDQSKFLKPVKAKELAKQFNVEESMVSDLFVYYLSKQEIQDKLTLSAFLNFVNSEVLTNKDYHLSIDEETLTNMKLLQTFSDKKIINSLMDVNSLKALFGDNVNDFEQLYMMLFGRLDKLVTPYEFINAILTNEQIKAYLDVDNPSLVGKLEMIYNIMYSTLNSTAYDYRQMSEFVGINVDSVKYLYALYLRDDFVLSPYNFVDFVLQNQKDEILKNNLNKATLDNLALARMIMNSVINKTRYSSQDMSKLINTDQRRVNLIYSLYEISVGKKKITLSNQEFIHFLTDDVMNNKDYKGLISEKMKTKLLALKTVMNDSLNNKENTSDEVYHKLLPLVDSLDKNGIELLFIYYGSYYNYNDDWALTIEKFVDYLDTKIINNSLFSSRLDDNVKENINRAKDSVTQAKDMLVGKNYSRVILNTKYALESDETFDFVENVKDDLKDVYVVGDSAMAYEVSQSFGGELNLITVLTMIFIFVVVVVTFKSILIPIVLVLLVQCAVFLTMGILSFSGSVYFIAILIVQSILMGATIDYAILYTSCYLEAREKEDLKSSIVSAYNGSIHTILNSALILTIVTLIVGAFSSNVSAKICRTISEGTLCSAILIIFLLPSILTALDRYIVKKRGK